MNRKLRISALVLACALPTGLTACSKPKSSTAPKTKNAAISTPTTVPVSTIVSTTTAVRSTCILKISGGALASCKPIESYLVVWTTSSGVLTGLKQLITGGTADGQPGWQNISVLGLKPPAEARVAVIDLTFADGSAANAIKVPLKVNAPYEINVSVM